jgi:hypothetical protein
MFPGFESGDGGHAQRGLAGDPDRGPGVGGHRGLIEKQCLAGTGRVFPTVRPWLHATCAGWGKSRHNPKYWRVRRTTNAKKSKNNPSGNWSPNMIEIPPARISIPGQEMQTVVFNPG